MGIQAIKQEKSKEILAITLTEIMLLFVFGFLIVTNITSSDLESLNEEFNRLLLLKNDLVEFKANAESTVERLGTTLDALPHDWNRLAERQAIADKFDDARLDIERLAQENTQLEQRLETALSKASSLEQRVDILRRSSVDRIAADLGAARLTIAEQDQALSTAQGRIGELAGRVKFLQRRSGGRDKPPCWTDAEGQPQFLLSITLYEDGFVVEPAWRPDREIEARSLGLTDGVLGRRISQSTFMAQFRPIYSQTVSEGCRHYAYIRDSTLSKAAYKQRLGAAEAFFYKLLRK